MHNIKEMDSQRPPGPPVSLDDQPVQLSCLQAIPAASNFSLSPVILQPEHALSQTIYLKALTIPIYQPIQSECLQPNSQLPAGQTALSLKNKNTPLILSPLVHSEGTDRLQPAPQAPPQTINIVSGLPVLPQNPSPCAPLGSPGKSKSAGKYLCKHCGRDCLKPSVLEKHLRSHTGERPFPCTVCGIAFKTQSNLYKHRRTQTHVNNMRPPSESDSSSLLEENEKEAENIRSPQTTKNSNRNGDFLRAGIKQAISDSTVVVTGEKPPLSTSLSAGNTLTLVSESHCVTPDNSCHGGVNQSVLEKDTVNDLANLLQRGKAQEQRSPTVSQCTQLERQQVTYPEKFWDSKSPDYKLKKCESTDSGYLSRSDSVEQQMLSPSPLHSLCEHSTESEGEATLGSQACMTGHHSKTDSGEKITGSLVFEKRKLEEHISKLISHNKAVVDDTQLDNVRPRKTVLSKQGSIDLPMPYTYKDSFHFDIRSLDVNRRKNLSLCSAKSIFTPVEKVKPLFFHSVPTQFSTTIDCVPVTRSNSLPFVESTRRIQDQRESSSLSSFTAAPSKTSISGMSGSDNFVPARKGFPVSHPRALVRQVAVDDMLHGNVTESSPFSEEVKDTKKPGARVEGVSPKCKRSSQRKAKMFSQEKWQVYGDETFKKIYQKLKSNQAAKKQKGSKVTNVLSCPSDSKEVASHERIAGHRSDRCPTPKNLVSSPGTVPAQLNTEESEGSSIHSQTSQSTSSQESSGSFLEFMETSFPVCHGEHGGMPKTFSKCRCRELHAQKQDLNSNDQVLPLNTELAFQLPQASGQENNTSTASLQKCDNESGEMCEQGKYIKHAAEHDDISPAKGEEPAQNETFPLAQEALRLRQESISKPVLESQKLPSERKKLKVDESKNQETLKISHGSNRAKDKIVKLLDQFQMISVVTPVSINHSVKGGKQKFAADTNSSDSSAEYKETEQYPTVSSSNRDYIVDNIANVSAFSFSEPLRAEVTEECICSPCSLQKLTENPDPMITGTRMSSQRGGIATASSPSQQLVFGHVTPHIKKNEFLPKYILKYPQEGNSESVSLVPSGEFDQKTCISLPTASTNTVNLSRICTSQGTSSVDGCVCPLQLEMSHLMGPKDLKWDTCTTWKPLVSCSPAILETTSITTRVDGKCHPHQSDWQKDTVKEILKGTEDGDNFGEGQGAKGGMMVCSSYTAGKTICFTSMYTGGFLISSGMKESNSAIKFIHSGNSSVISVSSLIERAASCGNPENKIKDWETDINSFPWLPTSLVDKSRSLCHCSDMLYCHVVCTSQKEVHTPPHLSVVSHVGNQNIPSLSISFPSLNAEPRLTWCCLTQNLPLPVEQKEKKDSAYSSLHTCKNEKPYFSTAGDIKLLTSSSEQKANKKLGKIRELTTTSQAKRCQKRKKVKIAPKRYKGSYGQRHPLLKTSRLSKQHRPGNKVLETPRKHHYPYILDGPKHCGKCPCLPAASQGYDQNLQQQAPSSAMDEGASLVEKYPRKEGRSDSTMTFSSCGSSSNSRQEDSEDGQVTSEPTSEPTSGMLSLQRTATVPATHPCTLPTHVQAQKDGGINVCSLGKLLKGLHSEHTCASTRTLNFELRDPSESHPSNCLCSEVPRAVRDEPRADCKDLLCMKSKSESVAVFKPLFHIMGRKEQTKEGSLYSPLQEKLPSVIQTPCYLPPRSKPISETSRSNICLPSSRHSQITSSYQHIQGGQKNSSSVQLADRQRKLCTDEPPAFKNPSAPFGSSGTPSRFYKKQTLEMMNKQMHVEEDTSSEDEDRLIIEI